MSTTSKIEDEFNKLNRDYEVLREQYNDFVKRREFAEIQHQEDIENLRLDFIIVEAPKTLPDPVEPNRPLLFALVFFSSCALGIAAPLVLNLIKRSDS